MIDGTLPLETKRAVYLILVDVAKKGREQSARRTPIRHLIVKAELPSSGGDTSSTACKLSYRGFSIAYTSFIN